MTKRTALTLICLALLLPSARAAHADAYGRVHRLRTLDSRLAESLVWKLCEDRSESDERCTVQVVTSNSLTVRASDAVHAAITRMLLERDRERPETLRYHLTLVRAKEHNGGDPSRLPDRIQRALDAVSELLSFKAFEIVDSGLVTTGEWASTMFADPSGNSYTVDLRIQAAHVGADGMRTQVGVEVRPRGGDELVLGSTFNVREGETVVAGSSRPQPGSALMLVVTALSADG